MGEFLACDVVIVGVGVALVVVWFVGSGLEIDGVFIDLSG